MKIAFCGDVSVKDSKVLFEEKKTKELFYDIPEVFKKQDRVVVNLECAVTEDLSTPIKKFGPNLGAPLNTVAVLKEIGVTDCALSNNHIFDYGRIGLKNTIKELDKFGINYTGVGKNVEDARKDMIITDGKIKIAIVDVCEHEYSYALADREGAREFDPFETADDIAEAKKKADYVVLIYHGGKEHCLYPSPRLKRLCRSMVRRGADLVLCQHTHCIGCYEDFEGGHILYGQGNFHFVCKEYGKSSKSWDSGLIVAADFSNGVKVELIPVVVKDLGICLAEGAEKEEILNDIKERSALLEGDKYLVKWHEFCESVKYYRFIEHLPENELKAFAHYLDCEAHTDVWRELYKTANFTNEKD